MTDCAYWIRGLLNPPSLKVIVGELSRKINRDKKELRIEALAVTGLSGMLVAGAVSIKTNLPIIAIRKSISDNHSTRLVEYPPEIRRSLGDPIRFAIIDDLISSGKTVDRIKDSIGSASHSEHVLVKIYLYESCIRLGEHDYNGVPVYSFYCNKEVGRYKIHRTE